MIHSRLRHRTTFASLLALAALGVSPLHASTYTWLATGPNTNWLNAENYGGTGTLTPNSSDVFIFDAGTRNANVNADALVGKIIIGPNFGDSTTNANLSQASNRVISINSDGTLPEGHTAGIQVLTGRTLETNINARLNLSGNITISNGGGSRLRLGVGNGAGGLAGTGTLNVTSGVVLLPATTNPHSYSGAVTVDSGGTLQVNGDASFTTYSSLSVGANGTLSGGGTFASADVHSGGRISPGGEGGTNAGAGTLTFTNLLNLQSTGLVAIDIKPSGADAINATAGSIVLGGELRLRLDSAYTAEGTYQILLGLGPSSGDFNSVTIRTDAVNSTAVNLTSDENGLWSGEFASRGYQVAFDANTGVLTLVNLVPEPSHFLLSALGVLALLRRRR